MPLFVSKPDLKWSGNYPPKPFGARYRKLPVVIPPALTTSGTKLTRVICEHVLLSERQSLICFLFV